MAGSTTETTGDPILAVGERIHVITRRGFEGDLRRHFAGTVTASSGTLARAEGYVFVFDPDRNQYHRREGLRTRVFALGDAGLIVNVLPPQVDPEGLFYTELDRRLVLMDRSGFHMEVNEFGPNR